MSNNHHVCGTHNIIRPNSSSLTRAPSWSLGVGATVSAEGQSQDCCASSSHSNNTSTTDPGPSDSSQAQLSLLPVPESAIFKQLQPRLSLSIPTVYLTKKDSSSSSYHVYQLTIKLLEDGEQWSIYRRYSQFHALHQQLKSKDPNIANFHFPPKKRLNSRASTIVQERRRKLEEYMRCLNNYVQRLPDFVPRGELSEQPLQDLLLTSAAADREESPTSSRLTSACEVNSLSDSTSSDHLNETNSLQNGAPSTAAETAAAANYGDLTGGDMNNLDLLDQQECDSVEPVVGVRSLFNNFISLKEKKGEEFDAANIGG